MLLMLDLPDPLLPMSSTFFFFGFFTSGRSSAGLLTSLPEEPSRAASGELDMLAGESPCGAARGAVSMD